MVEESQKLADSIRIAKLKDLGLLMASATTTAMGMKMFIKEVADYHSQASALTDRVYSMADKITPEVVEQANEMVSRFAEQPGLLNAALLSIGLGLSLFYANQLGNPGNYEK